MNKSAATHPPPGFGQHVWIAGVLANLYEAGIAVSTCVAGLEPEEFFASCLTCKTALNALAVMRLSTAALPPRVRNELGGVDWSEWEALATLLPSITASQRERVWYAMRALVPSQLISLRRLRRRSPQRFNLLGLQT